MSWHLQSKLPMVCPMTSKVAVLSIAAPWANKVSRHSSAHTTPKAWHLQISFKSSEDPQQRSVSWQPQNSLDVQAGLFTRCHDYFNPTYLRTRSICVNWTKSIGRRLWKHQQTHKNRQLAHPSSKGPHIKPTQMFVNRVVVVLEAGGDHI